MEILIWPSVALFLFAVLLRSGKRLDGIDWKSRGSLLLLSTTICLLLDRWIRISALNAAEAAATTGTAVDGLVVDIAARYQPVLLPLYIAIVAVLIDLLARLYHRGLAVPAHHRDRTAFRTLLANALLLVAAPALLYACTINFASSGSILGDAARDVLMPIIATYGAPAHWLQVVFTDSWAWQRVADASWPWNPSYRSDSYLSFYRFLTDCLPWATLAVLLSLVALARSESLHNRSIRDYFVTPMSSSHPGPLARIAFGPWRGRAALAFTTLWVVPLVIWLGVVILMQTLSYVLLGLFILVMVAPFVWLIILLVRMFKARTP